MNSIIKIVFIHLALLFVAGHIAGQNILVEDSIKRAAIWGKISPYFSPPEKYKGKYDHYRSPLKFYNGDTVATPQDWAKRRKEIRQRWMKMMGEWPPLLTKQKLKILDSMRRDGFMQYQVQFYWTPN